MQKVIFSETRNTKFNLAKISANQRIACLPTQRSKTTIETYEKKKIEIFDQSAV